MFEATGAVDHVVVDDPDDPSRHQDEEEIVVQVLVPQASTGDPPTAWHRLLPNHQKTACGLSFHAGFASLRKESLDGELCLVCFSTFERSQPRNTTDDTYSTHMGGRVPSVQVSISRHWFRSPGEKK
jgi:hypothetical protein